MAGGTRPEREVSGYFLFGFLPEDADAGFCFLAAPLLRGWGCACFLALEDAGGGDGCCFLALEDAGGGDGGCFLAPGGGWGGGFLLPEPLDGGWPPGFGGADLLRSAVRPVSIRSMASEISAPGSNSVPLRNR